MKKHRTKIIIGVIVAAVLAVSFLWGGTGGKSGGSPPDAGSTVSGTPEASPSVPAASAEPSPAAPGSPHQSDTPAVTAAPNTGAPVTDTPDTELPAAETPVETPETQSSPPPSESVTPPETADTATPPDTPDTTDDGELTCTLIISCATILDNMDKLREGKDVLIPSDGIILSKTVVFYEGESVFEVLRRETKSGKIHLEFVNAPVYGSAYIEGIGNLYEFDCGERSGWMYSVNGDFPTYGSSKYTLSAGDKIEWLFTCDRGEDIGGSEAADSYING